MADLKEQEDFVDLSGNIDVKETPKSSGSFAKRSLMSFQLSNLALRDMFQKTRDSVQPWGDFFHTSRFRIPKSVGPAGKRVVKNIEKFQSNYLFVFLALVAFCILTSPMLLIAIAACLGACYIISLRNQESKFRIMGREVTLAQQYAGVGLLSFPLFWVAGAGSVVFWVIGASFFAVMLHASMYSLPEEQEAFEELEMETV